MGTLGGSRDAALFSFGAGISADLAAGRKPISRKLGFLEVGRVTVGREEEDGWHYEFRGRELAGKRFEPTATELQVEQRLSEGALEARAKSVGAAGLADA